jgi:hypothetical protein
MYNWQNIAQRLRRQTNFHTEYDIRSVTPEGNAELVAAVISQDAYITGGHTAEQEGKGATPRTRKTGL